MDDINPLALEEQVCFALAVASRSVIASYRSVLEPLGLTHPQYLAMLALWEHGTLSVKALGDLLHLEPATISPLVKRLEQAELVTRTRSSADERLIDVALTSQGRALRRKALKVPATMLTRFGMTVEDLRATNAVLHRIIDAAEAVPA
ncbi:MarR family winged helix-turn-helix transcriptional regulator [Aeromicrobium sp. 9AM]|uniref:MarR family winged helix-turn-helix transcriptional regulator n=1 Tax=Aeromicrobium sp. 9AM TaxID=2653126 RepID=UPI0012F45F9D|nr:MarR family transcriptional regulator [Aeromicrobium sp. 9AM]VXC44100.1 Organic hydroperoxide resistance transcriptional regulator [Aeromicrobium sp. 9AM]